MPAESAESVLAESLKTAIKMASTVSYVPGSFYFVLRSLIQEPSGQLSNLSAPALMNVSRFVRVPSVQAPLYYCAALFLPDKLDAAGTVDPVALASLYSTEELAGIIGVLFYARKLRSLCTSAETQAEWARIAPMVELQANIGIVVGQTLPEIGSAKGLLVGALPSLSLTLLLLANQEAFKEYRRHLKTKSLVLDPDFEMTLWGCSSVQLGAVLAQSLGFGVNIAGAFALLSSPRAKLSAEVQIEAQKLRAAFAWIMSLGAADSDDFAVLAETSGTLDTLLKRCAEVREGGERFAWLQRGKADLSPEKTPRLFGQSQPAADLAEAPASGGGAVPAGPAPPYSELSSDITALIPAEDYNGMSDAEKREAIEHFGGS